MIIFQNENFYIEPEPHSLPWLKIFTQTSYKELTDMPRELRDELWRLYYIVEEEMRSYFQPDKINMASFANMLPRVHVHVIARYKDDAYFPNPVWGEKMREDKKVSEDFELFYERIADRLKSSC